jgi:hypothetical protein
MLKPKSRQKTLLLHFVTTFLVIFAFFSCLFATVHFYNQSKEKGIKATGIGIE